MQFLFLFLDGVGLGADDPQINPFARAAMPNLVRLLGGQRLLAQSAPYQGARADLLPLDASLGVPGLPQSATGQTVLLTGVNVPAALGYHYGPKPNPPVAEYLRNGNLFRSVQEQGLRAGFLNAYPHRYFEAIGSGKRMYSAIPLAATEAGLPLFSQADLKAGRALAADFTARGWREHLGLAATPLLGAAEAGERLAALAREYHFAFFEYWLSDYAGHKQEMGAAVPLLEEFDLVLGGLLAAWDDHSGLILITSDHGNLEDLSTRRHTGNPVPGLLIGSPELRETFIGYAKSSAQEHRGGEGLIPSPDLTDIAPAILKLLSAS
jgi:hypothetical protein